MKKIFSIFSASVLAASAFAAEVFPVNSPQSGVLNFSGTSTLSITNTFIPPFTIPPAVILTPLITNNTPYTFVSTSSNLIVTASANTLTNGSVAFQAFLGYARIATGTNTITGGTPLTNTFAFPFAFPPIAHVVGSTTNGISATTTATTIILNSAITQNIQWGAFGQAFAPGIQSVTF